MKIAIAVETFKHPEKRSDYKVWYLTLGQHHEIINIGILTREELVQDIFQQYRKNGKSGWRAFCVESERSREIEVFDFIAQNSNENTHFGNLPTLDQFQSTLDHLQMNFEVRSVAC